MELAKASLDASQATAALDFLERARRYPDNLAEGKLAGAQENHIHFYRGEASAQLGNASRAEEAYRLATRGSAELGAALYYNDQPPEMVLYQALAHAALGNANRAGALCRMLVDYGEKHAGDDAKMDYFAVSLPDFLVFDDDLTRRNRIHCHYMAGLGYLGLGAAEQAMAVFDAALALEPAHLGATTHRRLAADLYKTAIGVTSQNV